jgi:SAM-dependent methyltransferase
MSPVFDAYADYYDLLYRDKDYAAEAAYVASLIRNTDPSAKRILELGCGTGGHATCLAAMGYTVHGVDISPHMLSRAESRKAVLPKDIAARLSFAPGDVRTVRTGESYDAVISLFHVMSYQTGNDDLMSAFQTAFDHLSPGGMFLFDFWYGPAVLSQKPEVRVKHLEDEHISVVRIAEPLLRVNESTVDVNYCLFISDKGSEMIESVTESHKLRYLFLTELELLLAGQFISPKVFEWLTENPPGIDSWSALLCTTRA